VIVLAVLGGLLLLVGLCAVRGWTTDSRDPEYSAGRLLAPRGGENAP
jgi:hypothetical protein